MRILFVPILVLSLSACSNMQQGAGNIPQPGFDSPGIGAATGGVLGAGVGAVIGSTSGNLGTGAAIGTLAGAAAGAAIGKHIQGQTDAYRETEEQQIRQQDLISNNGRQLQDLRNRHSDDPNARAFAPRGSNTDPFPFNHPSYAARSFSFNGYDGHPRAQRLGQQSSYESQSFRAVTTPSRSYQPAAVAKSAPVKPVARVAPPVKAVETKPMVARHLPVETVSSTLPPANTASPAVEVPKSPIAVPAPVAEAPAVSAPAPVAKAAQAAPVAPVNDDNCKKAQDEVEVARNAISEADQLFYYRRALRLCPSNSQYHLEIGKVYSSLNRKEDAQFELRQATELDPNNKQAADLLSSLETK